MASFIDSRARSNTICKYALRGCCKFGDSCFYLHDVPENNTSQIAPVCKYFLEGRCMFGNNCVFSHDTTHLEVDDSNDLSNSSSNFSSPTQAYERTSLNPELVVRLKNKPKLSTFNSANSEQETKSKLKNEQNYAKEPNDIQLMHTPSSYYEALTGKKYSTNIDLNELDGNMFDENYIEYLRRKQMSSKTPTHKILCPYFEKTMNCPFGDTCEYVHGELCDICNMPCLNPFDPEQCESHRKDCMDVIEKDMQEAFAAQCSAQKACGVCMEIVWDKEKESDRRFGILENCNHIFCLACIRKWRSSNAYENKIVKACPECRVKSDFVTPSRFWFEDENNKKHIIEEYKMKLGKTACKYYKQGDGECPFGNKCFYLHRNKDGSIPDLPEPGKRRRFNRFGDLESYSNYIQINFDYSDDEDEEYDLIEFLRNHIDWDDDSVDFEWLEFFS